MLKILIITRTPWDNTNSIGNTLSCLFGNYSKENIAHLYCRSLYPNNTVCRKYFSVTEKDILKNIISKKHSVGRFFETTELNAKNNENRISSEENIYAFFRNYPSNLALWLQELVWSLGNWKSNELKEFLINFKPDIIFAPAFSTAYLYKLLWFAQKTTSAKVVLFHADDYISVRFNYNLFSYFIQLFRSKKIKTNAIKADLNYCISTKQKDFYELKIKKEMRLLFKGADFNIKPSYNIKSAKDTIQIIFIGSILYGRWKTLGMLARAIKIINKDRSIFELLIYSQYEPSEEMKKEIIIENASEFKNKIPASEVTSVLNSSDIVLHVETFDKKERLKTKLSFSTKIVDLLHSGRPILAIGWDESASIDYLIKNDAALVARSEPEIIEQLNRIIADPGILSDYSNNAWECGKRNHQIDKIQNNLINDLNRLLSNGR